jgi:peroxiredoxin
MKASLQHGRLWLRVSVLLVASALIAIQVRFKAQPDAAAIARFGDSFTQANEWVGRVAPDFEMRLLDGRTFRMADEVGEHVVVLNFFATWCKAEMPELERFQRRAGERVMLLGVDAEEKESLVAAFRDEMKLTFPIGIDESGDIQKQFGVSGLPTTVVIGADGRVKLYETGAIANADVTLRGIVETEVAAIVAGQAIGRDAYLKAIAESPTDEIAGPRPLNGRARRIADAMPCPCGCDDHVSKCGCKTAKGIKARLAQNTFDGHTDADVMEALNKEFCMKGM